MFEIGRVTFLQNLHKINRISTSGFKNEQLNRNDKFADCVTLGIDLFVPSYKISRRDNCLLSAKYFITRL